ncbi:hypothetical protein BT67DRAFT_302985 [Trichocladium antarcticum]|uniref:Uncharacterized protein n=1 Tax=Trichocladium antarcticum TaxID=1450529 RepID=A0AAN6UKI8_9PEZI|nr:hypothetical protein BT67DRAFT_302985 [Trichocladium antarcticum]
MREASSACECHLRERRHWRALQACIRHRWRMKSWASKLARGHSELTTISLWYICSLLDVIHAVPTHNREYGCQALPDARHGPLWHHANTEQLRLAWLLHHCMYRRSRLGMLKRFSRDMR